VKQFVMYLVVISTRNYPLWSIFPWEYFARWKWKIDWLWMKMKIMKFGNVEFEIRNVFQFWWSCDEVEESCECDCSSVCEDFSIALVLGMEIDLDRRQKFPTTETPHNCGGLSKGLQRWLRVAAFWHRRRRAYDGRKQVFCSSILIKP
jgi:hypothetical protein